VGEKKKGGGGEEKEKGVKKRGRRIGLGGWRSVGTEEGKTSY